MQQLLLKKAACIFLFIITTLSVHAQIKIYGLVKDAGNKPAVANVLLLNEKDSLLVKGTTTGPSGNFVFENVTAGKYILHISATGFKPYYYKLVAIAGNNDINTGEIALTKEAIALAAVTLVSRKPMFEQKTDRMVVNVKNSITSAGSTALEVLEKSPGVIVNRQSNAIGLNGKDGVVVMINGKINRMPMDAVVQMLNGMNAANIDRIELITTPPANFDAEGNAGFINIILINNPDKGFNGSASLTMGYGNGYSPAGATNFNYRNKKINFFGDYSFTWENPKQNWSFFRRSKEQGIIIENTSLTKRRPETGMQIARLGIDIQVSPKTIIGAIVGGYNSKWLMTANNTLSIVKNNILDTTVSIANTELNHWKNLMGNINFSHTIKEGEAITADIDYLYYKDNNPNDYTNKYFNSTGILLGEEYTKSSKVTPFTIWVAKMDYNKKVSKKVTAEAGIKMAVSKFTNDVAVETLQQTGWVKDPELTSKYNLKENIAAAYTSFAIAASGKTNIKLGLRYEYTTSNLGSIQQQNIVDRKYGRFFPSIFISNKIDDKNSINLSASRRITRPTFKDMAPFVIFIDPYTFFSGNSGLQPAFSYVCKADYLYTNFVFSVSYTKEVGSIAGFQPQNSKGGNKQILAAQNLDNIKTFNIGLSLPFTIASWWNMQNNIQANWQELNAVYSKSSFSITQKNYSFNSSQNFILPRNYSMELSGFYQSKALFGATVSKVMGILNFGVQKKFADNKSKLRAGVDNIFNSGKFIGTTDIPAENIYTSMNLHFMFRTFKATYSYNFGNNKLKDKRTRGTASDEEQGRLK